MPTPLELFDRYFDDEMFLELTPPQERGNCKYCYLTLKKRKDVWSVCNTCGAHLHMECMRPWHLCVQKYHGT